MQINNYARGEYIEFKSKLNSQIYISFPPNLNIALSSRGHDIKQYKPETREGKIGPRVCCKGSLERRLCHGHNVELSPKHICTQV